MYKRQVYRFQVLKVFLTILPNISTLAYEIAPQMTAKSIIIITSFSGYMTLLFLLVSSILSMTSIRLNFFMTQLQQCDYIISLSCHNGLFTYSKNLCRNNTIVPNLLLVWYNRDGIIPINTMFMGIIFCKKIDK